MIPSLSSIRSGARTPVILLLILSLLLGACAPAVPGQQTVPPILDQPLPPPDEEAGAPARLAGAIGSSGDYFAMVEALARAGVRTLQEDGGKPVQEIQGDPSPLWFNAYQVENLAREARAHMGTLGADLDALAPVSDIPPLSYLLAAYVVEAGTFGAQFSRALMADANFDAPPDVIYPTAVIALFLADVLPRAALQPAGALLPGPRSGGGALMMPVPAPAMGVCGALSGALEDALSALLSDVLGSFLGSIVAGAAARYGIEILGDSLSSLPIIRQIRQVLAMAAMVAQFGSLLRNWSVQLASDGGTYHYDGGGGSPASGVFTATVDSGGSMRMPPSVKECAALARIQLPEIAGAEGSAVVWTQGAGWGEHAHETGKDAVVAADQTAKLNFRTSTETALDHSNGVIRANPVSLQVQIKRNDVEQMKGVIAKAVKDLIGIPGIGSLVQEVVSGGVDALAGAVMNPRAQASIVVEEEVHAWESRFVQPGACGGAISLDARSCSGLAGPWTLRVTCSGLVNGATSTTFAFDGSAPVPPPVEVEWAINGNAITGIPLEPGRHCNEQEHWTCYDVSQPSEASHYVIHVTSYDGYEQIIEIGANGGQDVNLEWSGTAALNGASIHAEGMTTATAYMGGGGSSSDSVDFALVPLPDQGCAAPIAP